MWPDLVSMLRDGSEVLVKGGDGFCAVKRGGVWSNNVSVPVDDEGKRWLVRHPVLAARLSREARAALSVSPVDASTLISESAFRELVAMRGHFQDSHPQATGGEIDLMVAHCIERESKARSKASEPLRVPAISVVCRSRDGSEIFVFSVGFSAVKRGGVWSTDAPLTGADLEEFVLVMDPAVASKLLNEARTALSVAPGVASGP